MHRIFASALVSLALFAFAANAQEVETEQEFETTQQQPGMQQQPAAGQQLGSEQQVQQQQMGQQQAGGQDIFSGGHQASFQGGGQQAGGQGDLQQSAGTIQGAVQSLDYEKGLLTLDTGTGRMTLRAQPLDIAQLNPGDVVSVPYGNYDGQLWVSTGQGQQHMDSFAVNGKVTGTLSSVDKSNGTVTIRGQTFRAHPETVEQLVPGQFIQVDYARVAGTDWISNVNATSGGQQQQGIRKASSQGQ